MIEETHTHYEFCELVWRSHKAEMRMLRFYPIISVSQENLWALDWLWDGLSFTAERLSSFLQEVTKEMENTTGVWASSPQKDLNSQHPYFGVE